MSDDLYADLFELAPVSLWIEDYSGLKRLFERWRAEGVSDLRAHLRARPGLITDCARQLRILRVNQHTLALYGAHSLQHLNDHLHLVLRDDMLSAFVEELGQLWDGQLKLTTQTINYTLGGERLHMRLNACIVPGHEADWDRVLIALENVTERQHAEDYARSLFEHSPVSLWSMDFGAVRKLVDQPSSLRKLDDPALVAECLSAVRVLDVNRCTLVLFGAQDAADLATHLARVLREDLQHAFGALLRALAEGTPLQQQEARTRRVDGATVWVELQLSVLPGHEQLWTRVLMSLNDITARKHAQSELAYVSSHDELTGLYNRSHFNQSLTELDHRRDAPVSLVVLDLDGLKPINDTHGHAAGDALLRQAGRLIGERAPAGATAARIGGDEFALLLPGWAPQQAEAWVHALRHALAHEPGPQGGTPPAFSIGMATRPIGADEPIEATLHRADARMYEDKRLHYAARGIDRRAR
jgi:diguanylate cyclase (GGDEF)-like protein/PAS domain S-box-containing protein